MEFNAIAKKICHCIVNHNVILNKFSSNNVNMCCHKTFDNVISTFSFKVSKQIIYHKQNFVNNLKNLLRNYCDVIRKF